MTDQAERTRPAAGRLRLAVASLQARTVTWQVVALVGVLTAAGALGVALLVGPPAQFFDLKIYYRAVSYWLDGHDIYAYWQADPVMIRLGYTYPPVAALLMAPMALLPIKVAAWVTVSATALCGFVCVWICVRAERRSGRSLPPATAWDLALTVVITLGAFAVRPVLQNIGFGQINVFLALLVLVDALVLMPRRSRWTGVGIGLAMAIKLTPGIFVLVFLVNRRWRAALVTFGTALVASLLAAALEPSDSWRYFTSMIFDSSRIGVLNDATNQSLNGLLARASETGQPSKAVWAILSLLALVICVRRALTAVRAGDQLFVVTVIGLTGLLISPVSWIHHAVWVAPALVILLRAVFVPAQRPTSTARWIAVVALLVSAIYIWLMDSRLTLGLTDRHELGQSPLMVIATSMETLWMAAALVLLPIKRSIRPAAATTSPPAPDDAAVVPRT